ncbi:hypothetical protein E2C01_070725 [Portunus trituberculatus]|uniref:Ig-like domain-containing protein n=1 Tax=Portunus trituberculatus TaxID=210409 RepID=A0A5B7I2F0_PORTR|nr:hypothetical protein [Portunus trituberculatus]
MLGRMLQPDGIKEGMDVYFHCSVKANPKVYKITWYHNVSHLKAKSVLGIALLLSQ